uniref:Uncharacterized protein n=1 Tax=Lepeophtheirus salmonis TaxID=72036 RepID=A0A0K2VEB2_LEPSM
MFKHFNVTLLHITATSYYFSVGINSKLLLYNQYYFSRRYSIFWLKHSALLFE